MNFVDIVALCWAWRDLYFVLERKGVDYSSFGHGACTFSEK